MDDDARVAVLVVEVAALRAELVEARAVIAQLRADNSRLTVRVVELEGAARADSSTSSRPPSSDGLAKKPATPRVKGGRRGKQPGTGGAHLAQVADPDRVVDHVPGVCDGCGGGLDGAAVVGTAARQVFDISPQRLVVTEHRAQRRRCDGCGTTTVGVFPDDVRAPAQYGAGVRAAIAYLAVCQHLPTERLARLLGDLLGAPVATVAVAAVIAETAAKAAPAVAVIGERLAAAPVVHADETGARVAGRLHWIHSASTDRLTLYHADPRRGRAAMDAAGALPAFAGVAVHDCWSPYWSYATDHALCGAHLLRELTAAAESGDGQDWARHLIDTLLTAKGWADDARAARRAARRAGVDPALLAALHARYHGHLQQGRQANPRGPRRTKTQALIDRLDRRRDEVLRFTADLAVPFDNNQAEVCPERRVKRCRRSLKRTVLCR